MELEPGTTTPSPERYWLDHITQCQEQNLSMAEYAKEHELKVSKLYYWKKRLKTLSQLLSEPTPAAFSRVQYSTLGSCLSGCCLRFPNGMIIEWDSSQGIPLEQLLSMVHRLP